MCGIAGLMTRDGTRPSEQVVDRFARALAHRGPDGDGRHLDGDVALFQNRLAIIDLVTGEQPLFGPEGETIVVNGEIYNYVELRASMPEVAFRTRSDCEPPIHLYRRHGLDFTRHMRGMYALALHDARTRRLVLARDPFGIKPLYYAETAAGFAFASEPQALIAAGLVAPRLARRGAAELLQLRFTTGRATIFEGIERVLPGEMLVLEAGRIVERRRLAALPAGDPADWSDEEALDRLDQALTDSVMVHQRADVPYGLFLSGGIDSASVLALMAKLNERPVECFTAGFDSDEVADERAQARVVAQAVGAEHVEVAFGESDFWALLPEIAGALDDPTADYAILPSYKLAREARKSVKVVLSGEGGDELFAGYGRYRRLLRPWWLGGGRQPRARGALDGLRLLRAESGLWREGIAAAEAVEQEDRTKLQAAQAVDCAEWLPNDLLTKLDRCLMAHGVEGRTPFLDPAVAAIAFRLADRQKIRDGLGKWLLRRWLERKLPQAQPFAPKRGFTVPVGDWMRRQGGRLAPLVARSPGVAELCHQDVVAVLFADLGQRADKKRDLAAWTLLFYALWHRRHIEGRPAEGGVFDVLSSSA
jgi:asparagine synthase (glutamine-hydrolysing)